MFERYTEGARRAVFFARNEASRLGCASIETEHLLLGLMREGDRFIAHLLSRGRLSMQQIRRDVESRSPSRGKTSTSAEIPLSPQTRRVLSHAAEEAERMQHDYIGAEHILLGLLREESSVAGVVLSEAGLRVTSIREELLLHPNERAAAGKETGAPASTEAAPESREPFHCDAPHGGDPQNGLFARFSERARRAIFFARYETSRLGGAAIETEHLLLGLMREGKGLTSQVFRQSQLSMDKVRRDIEKRLFHHDRVSTSVEVPLSPETKRALSYAAHESAGMGHHYIGTEHLLLGLLREQGGLAASILEEKRVTLAATRQQILALLAEFDPHRVGPTPPAPEVEGPESEPLPIELSELDRRFLGALKISAD